MQQCRSSVPPDAQCFSSFWLNAQYYFSLENLFYVRDWLSEYLADKNCTTCSLLVRRTTRGVRVAK